MVSLHPEYIIDEQQNKKSVVIPFIEWQKILEAIEELDDIKAYDKEKSIKSDLIPFEQAILEIQEKKLN